MARQMIHFATPGDRYGRLEVVRELAPSKKNRWVTCRCDCGSESTVNLYKLVSGHTRSCGCLHREEMAVLFATHGRSGTSKYKIWQDIIRRCYDSERKAYYYYGGRGIKVCDRWRQSFENFFADMGNRPSAKHSIDRTDNEGDYCPENCRWATRQQQARNVRSNHLITANGEAKPICEWAEITGLWPSTILRRIQSYGWSEEEAVLTPRRCRRGG